MPQLPLDPVPNTPLLPDPTRDAIWKRWFERLRYRTTQPGQIDHNDLDGLQGGTTDEYYHLTSAQHTLAAAAFTTQTANRVYAGPASGPVANPTFRALVTADLPAGVGTVTSVTVSGNGTFLLSSGSPITTSGTITMTMGPDIFAFAAAN